MDGAIVNYPESLAEVSKSAGGDAAASPGCRIRVLPAPLVKMIAAGEVVERPASVVKELIENSLDSGATQIDLNIEDGGRRLIRVSDDGCGMTEEELRLAVMPHATSKLAVEGDLYSLTTLGFRGEALASISSVSRLRLVSRPAASNVGHEIRITGEQVDSSHAAGCAVGTTVEVRDLFFNVPARRKFLRAAATEIGHVNEQFTRLALAHPAVGFRSSHNGRSTLVLPAGESRLERIGHFFGAELAAALLSIQREERGIRLEVYASPPGQSRATPQWQFAYVNGRYIRDRFVQHAIKESYRGLMEPNRHGVVFLFLTLDPGSVDVNVHPTKVEVRWADSNLIHSQVISALRESFQRADLRPALRADRSLAPVTIEEQERIRQDFVQEMKTATPAVSPSVRFDDPIDVWRALYGRPAAKVDDPTPVPLSESNRQLPTATDALSAHDKQSGLMPGRSTLPERMPPEGTRSPVPPRRPAVQMHNLYLVVEEEDGIVIVDQHALHERVMYEQLRRRLVEGTLESQRLLLPETLTVTARQAALLETHAGLLARLGIEVTPFGTDAVAIQTFPALLRDTPVAPFLSDVLDHLAQYETAEPEQFFHEVLDMMACKAAIKAGDRLTDGEIDTLMAQRHLIERATSCPHGRPTMLRFTKADLDRQFKRI